MRRLQFPQSDARQSHSTRGIFKIDAKKILEAFLELLFLIYVVCFGKIRVKVDFS